MATGQTLLDWVEILHPELNLQSGEEDVVKGLLALNAAQDLFENHAAQYAEFLGSKTGTVATSASTETTTYPSGVLRVDKLQFIDPDTSRPSWTLDKHERVGGHAGYGYWPYSLTSSSTTGVPRAYWTNGTNIYWDPLPDGTHTIRWYGFQRLSDITAGGTFGYDDSVIVPLAVVAAKMLRIGLDDDVSQYTELATDTFNPVLDILSNFQRDTPKSLIYRHRHDT